MTLRRICAVTILSLMLAGSALAGHIDTPGAKPAQTTESTTTTTTDITTSIVLTILSTIYR